MISVVQKFLDARKEERTAAVVGHQALQDMRGAVEAAQKRVTSARESLKAAQEASKKAAAATDDPPAQVSNDRHLEAFLQQVLIQ